MSQFVIAADLKSSSPKNRQKTHKDRCILYLSWVKKVSLKIAQFMCMSMGIFSKDDKEVSNIFFTIYHIYEILRLTPIKCFLHLWN